MQTQRKPSKTLLCLSTASDLDFELQVEFDAIDVSQAAIESSFN